MTFVTDPANPLQLVRRFDLHSSAEKSAPHTGVVSVHFRNCTFSHSPSRHEWRDWAIDAVETVDTRTDALSGLNPWGDGHWLGSESKKDVGSNP